MSKGEAQKVNYITHLLTISDKFHNDERLSALHVSLYYALFHCWNLSKFSNPVSICREEIMRASKIGSANTYTKCLKELDNWQYLKYEPSFNSFIGSKVHLYTFNKGSDKATDKGSDKGTGKACDKGTDKGSDKAIVKAVIPYINNSNNINSINNTNIVNGEKKISSKKISNNLKKVENGKSKKEPKKVVRSKGKNAKQAGAKKFRATPEIFSSSGRHHEKIESGANSPVFKRPSAKLVSAYFLKKQWPEVEGQKFFNHYESNGWLIGGKSPMQNWQAAAANWILNQVNFGGGKISNSESAKTQRPNHLNVKQTKDYNEPL